MLGGSDVSREQRLARAATGRRGDRPPFEDDPATPAPSGHPSGEDLVWVRRHATDWRQASYRLADLIGRPWTDALDRPGAGRLYAHVWCDAMQDGEPLHPCQEATAPHRISVCILRRDNEPLFEHLLRLSAGRTSTDPE
jgi:hypothetical protein